MRIPFNPASNYTEHRDSNGRTWRRVVVGTLVHSYWIAGGEWSHYMTVEL